MKLGITKREANALLHNFAVLQFMGTEASKNGFWNGLNADERAYMENTVNHFADAFLRVYGLNVEAGLIEAYGVKGLQEIPPAFEFAPEPDEEQSHE